MYLRRVDPLRPSKSSTSNLDIRIVEDQDGRFSTQFESNRSEMFGSGSSDDLPDGSRSGVEDVIPLQSQQFGRLGNGSNNDGVGGGVEVLGYEGGNERSHVDGDVGGLAEQSQRVISESSKESSSHLDDGSTSSGDGTDERTEKKRDGVIPGSNDEHRT